MAVKTAVDDASHLIRTYWSLFLGNVVEWYEFAVYGYLAIHLEKNLFRGSPIAVWLGFGCTFLARPLGGTLFGLLGDLLGRSRAVNLTIVGMLVGTCGQGLLPTFANGPRAGQLGIVLLVALHFLQGICAAGEITTMSAYIAEQVPKQSLGRAIAIIGATVNVGFLLAKMVTFVTQACLGDEAMESWGWRVPFIFALFPALLSIWGRRSLPESEAFLEEQEQKHRTESADSSPRKSGRSAKAGPMGKTGAILSHVFRSYWRNILVGIGGVAGYAIMQFGGFVWTQSYLAKRGMSEDHRMWVALCSRMLMIVLNFPVGWLCDVKGVGWVTFVGAVLLAGLGLPLFVLIDAYPTNFAVAMATIGVTLSLVGAISGTVFFLFVVELFPASVRGVGAGMSYNLGFAFFGGLAPTLAQCSLSVTKWGPGIILSTGGAITACTIIAGLRMERQGKLVMAHVRPQPYFGSSIACDGNETDSSTGVSDTQSPDPERDVESQAAGSTQES